VRSWWVPIRAQISVRVMLLRRCRLRNLVRSTPDEGLIPADGS
jgi:hypothetical protein